MWRLPGKFVAVTISISIWNHQVSKTKGYFSDLTPSISSELFVLHDLCFMLDEKQFRKKGTELDFKTKQLQISYLNTKANKGKYKKSILSDRDN